MADVKISGLPASTTPLDGTEVLPIVQGTTTKQVSIANVTAGRAVAAASVALTGVVTQSAGLSTPYTLASIGIPFVIVSSGSMGNNGALSGITAVKATYVNAYVYLPADAISAGSAAGWYYAVFSSTTAATVYDNVYTSGVPTIPGSPTAFVTTGPGAYTQTTGSYLSPMVITLPANSISANGFFTANVLVSTNNTGANSKLLRLFVDNSFASGAWAGGGSEWGGIFTFQNRGVTNRNVTTGFSLSSGFSALNFSTFNMTTSKTISFGLFANTATDTFTFESVQIVVSP